MSKRIGFLVGSLTILLTFLSVSSPALAIFEQPSGQLKGQVKSETTPIKITFELGGATVVCEGEKANVAEIRFQEADGQAQNQKPRHQDFHIEKWGACLATSLGLKTKAVLSPCELRAEPKTEKEPKSAKATIGVEKECEVKTEGCIIKIPTGKESPVEGNWGLSEDAVEDSGTSLIEKFVVVGIADAVNPTCEIFGITKTTAGKLKSTITFPDQNTV